MPKIERVLKSEIMRLAKRHVRTVFIPLKREVRQMRVKLSGLSKGIASLNRMAKELRLEEAKPKLEATPGEVRASRLTPDRIRNLRRKLGVSLREMGILTGASLGAVLSWEKGKFKPSGDKKAALVALRRLRKRDVKKVLAQRTEEKAKALPRKKKQVVKKSKSRRKRLVARK
jgi:DNA-binding transcriptional regulator YiaG